VPALVVAMVMLWEFPRALPRTSFSVRKQRGCITVCIALLVISIVAVALDVVAYISDPALLYYTTALRGAATPRLGQESSAFQQLARLHYQAVQLRRKQDFSRASLLYRRAIAMQDKELLQAQEVTRAVASAHSALNLALTEQAQNRLDDARLAFQNGAKQVQEQILREFSAWVDGQHRVRFTAAVEASVEDCMWQALKWLATLLTAWALLERKRGHVASAQRLVQRAANLDSAKAAVLRWKLV